APCPDPPRVLTSFPTRRSSDLLMVSSDLRNKLAELHAELARTNRVDAQSRELLATLADDIARLLGPPAPTSERAESTVRRETSERLEELAVQFDAEHPALSTAIRRVIDALAKAGI